MSPQHYQVLTRYLRDRVKDLAEMRSRIEAR
jgi:hypothetical protein